MSQSPLISNREPRTVRARAETWFSENSVTILFAILAIAILGMAFVLVSFALVFYSHPLSSDSNHWGQFSDYLGGTLNPILGFLSVLALLATLVVQGRELRVSTIELGNSVRALNSQNRAIEHQRFEQTFFAWLRSYEDQLESIDISTNAPTGGNHKGRRVLFIWWNERLTASYVWSGVRDRIPADDCAPTSTAAQ